jgi:hypothetical protein
MGHAEWSSLLLLGFSFATRCVEKSNQFLSLVPNLNKDKMTMSLLFRRISTCGILVLASDH